MAALNTTIQWIHDAVKATDPSMLLHPPPSKTGVDMTWVISHYVRYICAVCVLFACGLTVKGINHHVANFDYPQLQIYTIRILFMIPFYGVLTLISVLYHPVQFFLDTIRDTYEAFALYTFFSLLVAYCGGEHQLLQDLAKKRYKGAHVVPVCCLPMFPLGREFYLRCKRMVLQYALIKPVLSLLACITAPIGWYVEADFSFSNLYVYLFSAYNISISFSLYYLVLFHLEIERELRYCQPALKFVCIKAIIFFAFWQSSTVAVLIAMGWMFTGKDEETREQVNTAIQDVLICCELVPVSIMHYFAFSREKLDDEMEARPVYYSSGQTRSTKENLDEAFNLKDFVQDTFATLFFRQGRLMDEIDTSDATMAGREEGVVSTAVEMRGESTARIIEEVVLDMVTSDKGPRIDGILHYDLESDIEDQNEKLVQYPDNYVFSKTSQKEAARVSVEDANIDIATPSVFCVVCGRFDRSMVRRKSGFKCVECVGKKGKGLFKERQRQSHAEDNDGSCTVCGRKDRPMVRRGNHFQCIKCL